MPAVVRIALVGDHDPSVTAHRAIPEGLRLSAGRLGVAVAADWIPTPAIDPAAAAVGGYGGIWCVPGSPYAHTAGALAAVRFARVSGRPFLGTCGGFQHAVLEFARNVLGYAEADHAESSPDAAMPVIARLTCSLVEKGGEVVFAAGSRVRAIYGRDRAEEEYHCNYGENPGYAGLLAGPTGLRVAATDAAGEVRAVELSGHPFFVGTLYQPERAALRGEEHPLVTAFVVAAMSSHPVSGKKEVG